MASGEATQATEEGREKVKAAAESELSDDELTRILLAEDDGEETEEVDAEHALLAICLDAQQDRNFNAASVRRTLKAVGFEGFWESAAELLKEEADEGDELAEFEGED